MPRSRRRRRVGQQYRSSSYIEKICQDSSLGGISVPVPLPVPLKEECNLDPERMIITNNEQMKLEKEEIKSEPVDHLTENKMNELKQMKLDPEEIKSEPVDHFIENKVNELKQMKLEKEELEKDKFQFTRPRQDAVKRKKQEQVEIDENESEMYKKKYPYLDDPIICPFKCGSEFYQPTIHAIRRHLENVHNCIIQDETFFRQHVCGMPW